MSEMWESHTGKTPAGDTPYQPLRRLRFARALTPKRSRAILIGLALVAVDQVTKWVARQTLGDGPVNLIEGFLRLRLIENKGSAFSLFQDIGPLVGLLAIAAVVWILAMVERAETNLQLFSLALILGGAVGNLVDRIAKGAWLSGSVTDFIDFSFWPIFNVADSAITVGVVMLLWTNIRQR